VPDYNIVGKVQFSIPLLGYVAAFIQEPPGLYVAISVGAILILLVFLPDLLFDDKATKDESGNSNNKKNSKNKKKKEQDDKEPDLCVDAPENDTASMTDGNVGNGQGSLAEESSEVVAADEAENAADSVDQTETESDSDTACDEAADADESADSDDEPDGAKDDTEE